MESPSSTANSETQPVGVQYANQLYSAKTWAILDLCGDWVVFSCRSPMSYVQYWSNGLIDHSNGPVDQ